MPTLPSADHTLRPTCEQAFASDGTEVMVCGSRHCADLHGRPTRATTSSSSNIASSCPDQHSYPPTTANPMKIAVAGGQMPKKPRRNGAFLVGTDDRNGRRPQATGVMLAACAPFGPVVTSYDTR
jgi:hypothetical protein